MNPLALCSWLLLFGTFYNVNYIKSITPKLYSEKEYYKEQVEIPCFWFQEPPCYKNETQIRMKETLAGYDVKIANTVSGKPASYSVYWDEIISVRNDTPEYANVKAFLLGCTNYKEEPL